MRKRLILIPACAISFVTLVMAQSAQAPLTPTAEWATHAMNQYTMIPNVTYLTASGHESKLDVYKRRDTTAPQRTLIFVHGGGWVRGNKESSVMSIIPWLEMGWNVVNVEYRMLDVAPAPAAVEDLQCALRHVAAKAKDYGVDTSKIVLSGESAGGHLALTTGMIPESAGFDRICAGGNFTTSETALPKVAAIVNWYGITDINDLLAGANAKGYAVQWLGSLPNRDELARSISPLTYVRSGLPPILSIQGDADPIVPYTQNVRLHKALTEAGVQNELVTIPKGGHGNFKADERSMAYAKIHEFLAKNGL